MRGWILVGLILLAWTLVAGLFGLAMRDGSRLVTDIGRFAGYPAVETQALATAIGEAGPAGQILVFVVWLGGIILLLAAFLVIRADRPGRRR